MITDDERSDVARRLRELANYCDENEMSLADDDWPGILSDYIWPENSGYHIYDEDCRRLADLIEPKPERTCRMEYAGEVPPSVRYSCYFCSECGSPIYNDMEPSYCLYCGAKVVDDG